MMRNKLGLDGSIKKDKSLILDLLTWMHEKKADYTNTFCHLMNLKVENEELYKDKNFLNWKSRWQDILSKNDISQEKSFQLMRGSNPLVIPRNHKVEEVLKAAENDNFEPINKFLEILKKPYSEQKDISDYQTVPTIDKNYQTFCGT